LDWAAILLVLLADASSVRAQTAAKPPKPAAELQAAYARLETEYGRELVHLAHLAYAKDWQALGDLARRWRPAHPAIGSMLFIAIDQYTPETESSGGKSPGADPPAEALPWLDQFEKLRHGRADALFALAKEAAEAGQMSLAFQWATEAARENPDHAEARRVLGFEKRDGRWLSAYGARLAAARQPTFWHAKFGWIGPDDAARYEAGERRVGGRWMPAETDAARRTSIENGWQVRTDHFLVRTNHSLEAAAELAARLERLHQVWRQMFAGFYLSEREGRELFAGQRVLPRRSQPMRVYYHRNKDEYVALLRKRQPRIEETHGIYFDIEQEAHFFAGDGDNRPTLYHEAAHQLFHELQPTARNVGRDANVWIVEGVATYFETLGEHDMPGGPIFTTGHPQAGRLPGARRLLLEDNYYIPLAELTSFGKEEMQRLPELPKLYGQLAGLAAFLMDAEGGRYREALVRYLDDVYAGRGDARTLSQATGLSYDELDAAYHRFLAGLPGPQRPANLP
jgi:hypothetical protein